MLEIFVRFVCFKRRNDVGHGVLECFFSFSAVLFLSAVATLAHVGHCIFV